jgi:hypothetical protein
MPNGNLRLFNKQTNATLVDLNILGTFNIEDNLNDTPSNMKVKVITNSTYREEFEVNTIAFHEDTGTWWVIKSDESTYITTNEYEHEIALVEYLEFFGYRHLVNISFEQNRYSFKELFERLFAIAKLDVDIEVPNFLDNSSAGFKNNKFFSFDNFTLLNAIKTIARNYNAIPKLKRVAGQDILFFINRNGLDTAIVNTLNTQFPVAYEKNTNSSDQFLTRSISNLENVISNELVITPKVGGINVFTEGSFKIDKAKPTKIVLPSKIFKVDSIFFVPRTKLQYAIGSVFQFNVYDNYYIDIASIKQTLIDYDFTGTEFDGFDFTNTAFPTADFLRIYKDDQLAGFDGFAKPDDSPFRYFFTIKTKEEYDLIEDVDIKKKTFYYEVGTNEIFVPEDVFGFTSIYDIYNLETEDGENINLFFTQPNEEILFRVAYYPQGDIKVSYDNDNNAQDEKYFNQSGRSLDGKTVSKLIISHTNDSVEGTKIRNARYTALSSILPLGQIVRDSNQLYIVSQRSIDALIKNGNEYYNVIYTLSRNRIARSENISADTEVRSYAVSSQSLTRRVQLYKDYIELSLVSENNATPYLSMSKAFNLNGNGNYVGADLNFLYFGKSTITTGSKYHVISPSVYDLSKSKIIVADYKDNNIVGYKVQNASGTYLQVPISYVDSVGQVLGLRSVFCDEKNIFDANKWFFDEYYVSGVSNEDEFRKLPLTFYPEIPSTYSKYFDIALIGQVDEDLNPKSTYFSIDINEASYKKDAFEIPVVEYQIQMNDSFNTKGNFIVSDDIFKVFKNPTGALQYNWILVDGTTSRPNVRITNDNAEYLFDLYKPANLSTTNRSALNRSSATQFILSLLSSGSTNNTTPLQNKHIGLFATYYDGANWQRKFLFAINDYNDTPNSVITIYINNWKI